MAAINSIQNRRFGNASVPFAFRIIFIYKNPRIKYNKTIIIDLKKMQKY